MDPSALNHIEEVIEAHTLLWEFDLGSTLPAIAEAGLILIKRGTESPHTCENEEGFVDGLDLILLIIFTETFHVISLGFIGG
jgi:hypothetical protein